MHRPKWYIVTRVLVNCRRWNILNSSDVKNKFVVLDQGGEPLLVLHRYGTYFTSLKTKSSWLVLTVLVPTDRWKDRIKLLQPAFACYCLVRIFLSSSSRTPFTTLFEMRSRMADSPHRPFFFLRDRKIILQNFEHSIAACTYDFLVFVPSVSKMKRKKIYFWDTLRCHPR